MNLTNRNGLPEALVRALSEGVRKPYDPATEGKISVTGLLDPPRLLQLLIRHWEDLSQDVSDRIWALFGTAVHSFAERGAGADDLSEEFLEVVVPGTEITLRGKADLYTSEAPGKGTVWDYKTGSVYQVTSFKAENIRKWAEQLNPYGWMYRQNGFPVTTLKVVLIMKDWKAGKAYGPDYPSCPVEVITIPLWSDDKTVRFLQNRIVQHVTVNHLSDFDLPACTKEEFWGRDEVIAVYKTPSSARAAKLFPVDDDGESLAVTRAVEEAIQWAVSNGGFDHIGYRAPVRTRCEGYCPVKAYCSAYAEALSAQKAPRVYLANGSYIDLVKE